MANKYTAEELGSLMTSRGSGKRTWDTKKLVELMQKATNKFKVEIDGKATEMTGGVIDFESLVKCCPESSNLDKGKKGYFISEAANKLNEYFRSEGFEAKAGTKSDKKLKQLKPASR